MTTPRAIGTIALLAAALALPACGGGDGGATTPAPPPTTAQPAATTLVYFPRAGDGTLVAERREVAGASRLEAALAALAAGPASPDLSPALPAGTRVLGVTRDGDTAVVDLSLDFASGYPRGSAAEVAALGAIVFTATAVPGVERVAITVEGSRPDVPGAQFDLTEPLTRTDFPEAPE